jgi:hypothetical protein
MLLDQGLYDSLLSDLALTLMVRHSRARPPTFDTLWYRYPDQSRVSFLRGLNSTVQRGCNVDISKAITSH